MSEAAAYGRRLSGASMGLIGAVGALGGLGINLAFRQSFLSFGSGTGAFVAFLAFYAPCFVVTWAVYLRRPAPRDPTPRRPRRQSRSSATPRCDVTPADIKPNRACHAAVDRLDRHARYAVPTWRQGVHDDSSAGREPCTTNSSNRTTGPSRGSPWA